MKFIEMTGKTLTQIITAEERANVDLESSGVFDDTIIRVNEQGDIEARRHVRWAVIGGLLGDFENRVKERTGLDWAD